ncbi:protein of unknown function [Paraburkholderia dioscoreae]|uniref:Uncharacterized protein n=1 Tax=Paraburkholderia dioscoreae TaxID=2604047 RepID=A0A5Q4ZGU6_9BURK|nr:protein of unknown function [Paraburkholderia dioscoreae]
MLIGTGADANRAILFVFDDSPASAAGRRTPFFDGCRMPQFNIGVTKRKQPALERASLHASRAEPRSLDAAVCARA